MSLREKLLAENSGNSLAAAATYAKAAVWAMAPGGPSTPERQADAILAAAEVFPEVKEEHIRSFNGWPV